MELATSRSGRITRLAIIALAAFATIAADATTVTYNFTQTGWDDGGVLNGTFTGTPEAGGVIQLADLTNFNATFTINTSPTPNNFLFNTPTAFTFDPNAPDQLEFAAGSGSSGIQLCAGPVDTNVVCYGIPINSPQRVNSSGFFEDLPNFAGSNTQALPQVSPASTAPEPASAVLFIVSALFIWWKLVRRRGRARQRAGMEASMLSSSPVSMRFS